MGSTPIRCSNISIIYAVFENTSTWSRTGTKSATPIL
jgi:hypothetical protein